MMSFLPYISRSCTYTPALCRNFWHLVKYANLVIRSNYSTNKVFNFNPRLGFLFQLNILKISQISVSIFSKNAFLKKGRVYFKTTCLTLQILCTTQTREDHPDNEDTDRDDLSETPSVPSSASPKTAALPCQVEEPLSPLRVLDCSPAHSPKPCSPRRHLSFSPVINIQSPSASRDSIITRRDLTKLVSNIYMYFSRYENMYCCVFCTGPC